MRAVEASEGSLTLELPYSDKIVGDPVAGVIAGGALTTLMDSASGLVIQTVVDKLEPCPTLDLRIDYMRPATPGLSVFGQAEVYRVTRNIMFVRGMAYQDNPDEPVAHCVATFARIDPSRIRNNSSDQQPWPISLGLE